MPASAQSIFTEIYRRNGFQGTESISGPGSGSAQTRIISQELPKLWQAWNIRTLLDLPCGDFHWMKSVDLAGVDYLGGDIVVDLIHRNRERHARPRVRFDVIDLLTGPLPTVDAILCRDCMVHLSHADLRCVMATVIASGSTYLLATTFPTRTKNADITTGRWRTLNLEKPPLNFPPPIAILNEGCTEGDGAYADKSLGLWLIADLPRR